jgi:hypothetical protein
LKARVRRGGQSRAGVRVRGPYRPGPGVYCTPDYGPGKGSGYLLCGPSSPYANKTRSAAGTAFDLASLVPAGRVAGVLSRLPGFQRLAGTAVRRAATRGGAAPVLQGQAGVRESIREAVSRGERMRGVEITVQAPSGQRVRLDYLTEAHGRLIATEVKSGPTARLSSRQRIIFQELEQEGGTFVGRNAERAGLRGRFPRGPIRRDFRP